MKDKELWRAICFENSAGESIRKRTGLLFRPSLPFQAHPSVQSFRRRAQAALNAQAAWSSDSAGSSSDTERPTETTNSESSERNKRLANWDPSYQDEQVDWYAEYIARHGPLSTSWVQSAFSDTRAPSERLETRGMALHRSDHVLAPLEDGSVCLWSLGNELGTRRGAIQARSKPGILFSIDRKPSNPGSGVGISSVSVDDVRDKAYIAVQNYVQEIDLHTLSVSSQQRFPWAIATLSDIQPNVPLTVGTKAALHLFDHRQRVRHDSPSSSEHIEPVADFPTPPNRTSDFSTLLNGNQSPSYASLFQPGPTAIHHLFPHGGVPDGTAGEIIVAGRFPSLLIYDRRTFPKLRNTYHSGAQLCSLASLPYAFSSLEADLMRQSQLSVRAAREAKAQPGDTLFACGEYQGKGSLASYGLSSGRSTIDPATQASPGSTQISTYKNRVSAASSKLLSIAVHGTRLVVSDGDGGVRWLERDGQTLVRRWNINRFGSLGGDNGSRSFLNYNDSHHYGIAGSDVALKLLPLHRHMTEAPTYADEILFWTGEKIGLMGFSAKPRFGGDEGQAWEERVESTEEALKRREERVYDETMRRALERQADEVRWVSGLGLMG